MSESDPKPDGGEHIPLEPAESPKPPTSPAPSISKPPLTQGMSEDEIEAIEREETPPKKPKKSMRVSLVDEDIPEDALGAPGRLGWRFPLIAGAVAMLGAVVLAGVYASATTPWWKASLRQLIDAPLYAWVGVGALLAMAQLMERAFGSVYYVLARMAFAVGMFALLWQLAGAVVIEQSWHNAARWPMAALSGAIVYGLWCLYSFRMNRNELGMLAGLHLAGWMVLWVFRTVAL